MPTNAKNPSTTMNVFDVKYAFVCLLVGSCYLLLPANPPLADSRFRLLDAILFRLLLMFCLLLLITYYLLLYNHLFDKIPFSL